MKNLWEIDHPYYATEGNYYSNDCHMEYESWQDFLDEQGDMDLDMNLVYRWDWQVFDPTDYDDEEVAGMSEVEKQDTLELFYVGQRKAIHRSVFVAVKREEQAEIREWLTIRAEHMRKVWEPLLEVK